jgi:hypothetical protein
MRELPFLQIVNGKYRVRIVVPPELRPYLPPPHTGKANLTRALGTGTEREANTLVQPCCHNLQELLNTLPVWLLARPRFDHTRERLRTMQALR